MRKFEKIRNRIKELSEQQRELKPQRKTVYFEGNRTVEPKDATNKVFDNQIELRHLFYAYAKMKGKDLPVIKHVIIHVGLVDKYVKEYEPEIKDVA